MPLNTDPPCRIGPRGRHCNCFNEIWGRPGCQWCLVLDENKKLCQEIVGANLRISEMTGALNKIHDLAGQVGGSTANPEMTNLNLGAIQDWCHKVTEPCAEKHLNAIAMPCGCDSDGGKCSAHRPPGNPWAPNKTF
jgi:hypothetical protein